MSEEVAMRAAFRRYPTLILYSLEVSKDHDKWEK